MIQQGRTWALALGLLAVPGIPAAAELQVVPVDDAGHRGHQCDPAEPELQTALLRAVVNDSDSGLTTAFVVRHCGAVLARAVDLERLRIKSRNLEGVTINGQRFVPLDRFNGLSYRIDAAAAKLFIEADPRLFYPTVLDLARDPPAGLAPSAHGAFLNYGAYLLGDSEAGGSWTGNLGLGLFGPWGSAVSDWIALDQDGGRLARLNSTYQLDFPEHIASLRAGDLFSRAGGWGSGRPMGGLQLQTNFATRPGMVISPVQMMEALTARNAVLSLNTRPLGDADARSSPYFYGSLSTAPHGPVQVTNLPTYTNGEYELRVRDALGREQVVRQPYFFSQGLLRQGLHDYSYEAGWIREAFLSDDYGEEILAGTHRYGLNHWTTVEAHLEATESRQALGATQLFAVPWAGVLGLTVAGTRTEREQIGTHAALSLENRYPGYAYAIRHEQFSADFLLPGDARPLNELESRTVVSGATALVGQDSLSLSYAESRTRSNGPFRSVRANYSYRLPRGIQLALFGSQTLIGDRDWNAGLSLTFPLSALSGQQAGPVRNHWLDPRRTRLNAVATASSTQRSVSQVRAHSSGRIGDGHLGMALATTVQPEPANTLSGSWTNPYLGVLAGVTERPDRQVYTAGVSSALVLIGGRVKPIRSIYNSFALVRLGEENANVRVNGVRTDSQGDALISPLQAYYDNPIHINGADLPSNVRPNALNYRINPRFRSGVVLRAELPLIRDALLTIRVEDQNGALQPLPSGALVYLDGSEESFPVGADGRVYLFGLDDVNTVFVQWKGRRCDIAVLLESRFERNQIPEIGPLLCAGVRP